MVYSYVYGLWAVFIFLESFAVSSLRGKGLEPVRWFMIFCIFRDLLLLASASTQWYWDVGWVGKEIELIFLAGISGFMVKPGRAWRLPAATLTALFALLLVTKGWPFMIIDPADLHVLQRMACVIILGTILIGAFLIPTTKRLLLSAALVFLVGSDIVSAQSYLAGNFSPRLAAAIWVFGLCILAVALKGNVQLLPRRQPESPAGLASSSSSQMSLTSEWPSEATPQADYQATLEWLLSTGRVQ